MKVLILSAPDDLHADAVNKHLMEMGAPADYFRYNDFIQNCALSYRLGSAEPLCRIERDQVRLDLYSYNGIWHRRPGKLVAGKFPEHWITYMVENEARSALDGIFDSLRCVWVNYPPHDATCLQKLYQLDLAAKVGFSIPDSLVTNKPDLVEKFFEECDGEVIYKLIGESSHLAIPQFESPRGVSTIRLRKEDMPFLNQVSHAPHLFQRAISKKFELRVTVVGKELFALKIDSQSGLGKTDWRLDYSVEMVPFDLPDDIAAKSFELTRRLGLNYGAIDLIVTGDDQYVFLEINCAGQFLWVEQRTKQPISLALAKLLTGQTEPLVTIA